MPSKKRRPAQKPKRIFGGLCRLCGHFKQGVKRWEMRKASPARCPRCGGMLDSKSYKAGHVPQPTKEKPRSNRILLGPPIAQSLESFEESKSGHFPVSEQGRSGVDQESRTPKQLRVS